MAEDAAIIDPLMHGLRSKGLKKGFDIVVATVFILLTTWLVAPARRSPPAPH